MPPIRSDLDRLRRVVMNLVGNAVKYTEQGFILLAARVRPSPGKIRDCTDSGRHAPAP